MIDRTADTSLHERARASLLTQLLDELSAGAGLTAVMDVVLSRALDLLAGDDAALFFCEPDGRHLRGVLEKRRIGRVGALLDLDALPHVREVIRSGRPGLLTYATAAEAERARMDRLGVRATLVFPLVVEERRLGAVAVSFDREQAGLSESEVRFVDRMGRQCAFALDRAHLLESERRARSRLAAVQEVTSALVAARTEREVIDIMMDRAVQAFGAAAGTFATPTPARELVIVAARGYSAALPAEWRRLSVDLELPVPEAFRSGAPVFIRSREEMVARYPLLAGAMELVPTQAWAGVPLRVEDRCLGVLGLAFDEERTLAADEHDSIVALALSCAQALDRVRVHDAERRAWERLRRNYAVNAALAASRSEAEVLDILLGKGLEAVGAYAGVFVTATERGDFVRVAEVGYSPPIDERSRTFPASADLPVTRAFRRCESIWVGSRAELERNFPDALAMPPRARTEAWAAVPLVVAGRCLGVFGLSFDTPRDFPDDERAALVGIVQKCAQALERARLFDALERSNRQKDEFLAMLAHELRNPLAALQNATQVVKRRASAGERVDRAVEILERQVRNSARILDDLLDVSRITRGLVQLRRERVRFDAVVASAVESQRAVMETLRHTLTVTQAPEPIYVDGDPTRLEQIVANLLNNAAKYTPEGGNVALSVQRARGEVVLSVKDDGVGIAPEFLPRVFDLFAQADSSLARTRGGLGLGLTIVRRLAELHGGRVEASSEGPSRGSEFVLRLPIAPPPAVTPREGAAPGAQAGAARRRKVLVVEDNEDAAAMLAELLHSMGHHVDVASDGESGLAAASRLVPEIVLLDIGLPGLDGYEVARRIRSGAAGSRVALVALTGYGQHDDKARAEAAGFDRHLTKPIEPGELERMLDEL